MSFTVESLDQIHRKLLADFSNRFPLQSLSRYGDNWKRLRVEALGLAGLHAFVRSAFEAAMPDGATAEELDRHGGVHGLTRKPATAARKTDALRLVGTVASAFTTGDQLTAVDGLTFQVNETGTIPAAGYVDVDVLAVDTGKATRKLIGEVLTFVSPPAGIQATAELQKTIDEQGEDEESDQAYRKRILAKISSPGMGGNANDFKTWAEEVSGVYAAFVYPLRAGVGTVDVVALHSGTGTARYLSSTERADLLTYLNGKRPVSMKDFRVLETIVDSQDVEIKISVYDDALYRFDWNDVTPPTVSAVDTALRTITFSTLPADLRVGHRLTWKDITAPSLNTGAELVVESFPGGAVVKFTAASWETATTAGARPPEVGNTIYAGGPLVEPIRADIIAMMDSLGPARGSYAASSQQWEDSARMSTLYKLAQTRTGVVDTTIVTPASTVTPDALDSQATIHFLAPRQIIVRKA